MDAADLVHVLARIEIQERTEIVRAVAARAAAGDDAVLRLADYVSAQIRNMGQASALEMLARLGWWMIEAQVLERCPGEGLGGDITRRR